MTQPTKKLKVQFECFVQPLSTPTPAIKLIREYASTNGHTTLHTGHVSLGDTTLESEPSASLYEPHTDWLGYNDWDEVSPSCNSPIIVSDVLHDRRKRYAAVSEDVNDIS
jgi:hypothetical protein